MDKETGLVILTDVIKDNKRHQDYEHITELADKYYKMKTGDDITDLLEKIVTRETKEEFEQREDISKSVVPSILNSTQLPFQKAIRKQPLLREILYKGQDKTDDLEQKINTFWGQKSLEEYLEYALVDYNYIDPNAFLITEFDQFDSNTEKASPYPFVATSYEAIMYEYKNEDLQYLIVQLPIKFMENEAEQDGFKYTMYLGEFTLQMVQVGADFVSDLDKIQIGEKYFTYEEFNPKANKVPAARFGYLRDAETKG
ncbi:MAG TPA: hypothetical protein VFC41_02520, partial [Anaerovoracaceae bacterium]|nr:hypothetical protein [Anaerovoracaceae bacterium]